MTLFMKRQNQNTKKKPKKTPVYCTRPTVKMEIDEPLKLLQKAEQ